MFEIYRHFLELGRECGGMTEEKAAEYLEKSQAKQFIQHIPTAEKITFFGDCDDLCSPQDYINIYETPVDLVLESEKVWPVEPWLKY